MNAMIHGSLGAVPTAFAGKGGGNAALSAGVSDGFAVISYRGKVWRIKHRGEEHDQMRPDGDGPRASIEVVIAEASPSIAKIYYAHGYEEGSNAAPDCWSANGITPDATVTNKQAATCVACAAKIKPDGSLGPGAWGSRITEAGKKGKACSDSRRLVVLPAADLRNEALGGPMLLRVPAGSLKNLADYGKWLDAQGYPFCAVATRISFDSKEAFPKLMFNGIRALNDEEAETVAEMQKDPQVARIIATVAELVAETAEEPVHSFEQPPAVAKPEPAKTVVEVGDVAAAQKRTRGPNKPKVEAAPPTVPDVEETARTPLDDELDQELDKLLG